MTNTYKEQESQSLYDAQHVLQALHLQDDCSAVRKTKQQRERVTDG